MDTNESPTQYIWVEIPGYSRYQFNPQTKEVRSKASEFKYGASIKKVKGQILKPHTNGGVATAYILRRDCLARRSSYMTIKKLIAICSPILTKVSNEH